MTHIILTPRVLDELLTETVLNQSAEGIGLTAEDLVEVRRTLVGRHLQRHHWSPSWTFLQAVAVTLCRPDLLSAGREFEMFATGVLIEAGANQDMAWKRVTEALAAGKRGLVVGVLEALETSPQCLEKADPVRLRNLELGAAAAGVAGWSARLKQALGEG